MIKRKKNHTIRTKNKHELKETDQNTIKKIDDCMNYTSIGHLSYHRWINIYIQKKIRKLKNVFIIEYNITYYSNSYVLPFFFTEFIKIKSRSSFDFTGNIHAYITVFLHLYYIAAILKTYFYTTLVSICLHFHFVLFTATLLISFFLIIYFPVNCKDIYSNLAEVI